MFSDAHTHLVGTPFGENVLDPQEIQKVLKEDRDKGVLLMVVASHDLSSAERVTRIAFAEDGVYAAVGLHPLIATPIDDLSYRAYLNLARKPKVVAISEIGVDNIRSRASKEVQFQAFVQQLRLCREVNLPPQLHVRGYHAEMMEALKEETPPAGIIHGFTGAVAELKGWLDLGYYVSIGRAVLGSQAQGLKAMVQQIPGDRLLLETDGPDRSRGGVLEGQERVVQVAQVVASWRDTTAAELGEVTTENLRRVLPIQ